MRIPPLGINAHAGGYYAQHPGFAPLCIVIASGDTVVFMSADITLADEYNVASRLDWGVSPLNRCFTAASHNAGGTLGLFEAFSVKFEHNAVLNVTTATPGSQAPRSCGNAVDWSQSGNGIVVIPYWGEANPKMKGAIVIDTTTPSSPSSGGRVVRVS